VAMLHGRDRRIEQQQGQTEILLGRGAMGSAFQRVTASSRRHRPHSLLPTRWLVPLLSRTQSSGTG